MSSCLRYLLFAVTFLLLAEDFAYVFEMSDSFAVVEKSEYGSKSADGEEDGNGTEEKEEKKEEKKEKDENINPDTESLLHIYSFLSQGRFRDVYLPLSDVIRELESPPPEV